MSWGTSGSCRPSSRSVSIGPGIRMYLAWTNSGGRLETSWTTLLVGWIRTGSLVVGSLVVGSLVVGSLVVGSLVIGLPSGLLCGAAFEVERMGMPKSMSPPFSCSNHFKLCTIMMSFMSGAHIRKFLTVSSQ